jgi:chromosome segregation ATPase
MSSIGKIFVVGNLVLSLLVLGAAGALLKQTEVTKTRVAELESQLADSKQALAEANSAFTERERVINLDKQRLQEDKDDLEVARQNADRNVARLEADNQQLRDDVTKINSKLDSLESSYSGTLQRSQELTDLNATLRTEAMEAKDAQRKAELAQRGMTDQLAASGRQATELKDELNAVTACDTAFVSCADAHRHRCRTPLRQFAVRRSG